jgi:hypothetical protein
MSMQGEESHPYRAYLLRCWQEEILNERRRKGFSSLGALIAFLQAELAGSEEPSDDEPR